MSGRKTGTLSNNADELRIYAVAHTQARADDINELGTIEGGLLRRQKRML